MKLLIFTFLISCSLLAQSPSEVDSLLDINQFDRAVELSEALVSQNPNDTIAMGKRVKAYYLRTLDNRRAHVSEVRKTRDLADELLLLKNDKVSLFLISGVMNYRLGTSFTNENISPYMKHKGYVARDERIKSLEAAKLQLTRYVNCDLPNDDFYRETKNTILRIEQQLKELQ